MGVGSAQNGLTSEASPSCPADGCVSFAALLTASRDFPYVSSETCAVNLLLYIPGF